MTLYRPVGLKELELIIESGMRRFPPRLPFQPIFYPVLNETYAIQLARDWNTKDPVSGHAGFVTRFEVNAKFASRYERQVVGAAVHEELWVPAEELAAFNDRIQGAIVVTRVFLGEAYEGPSLDQLGISVPQG